MVTDSHENIVIERNTGDSALNFSFLRARAIELVQQYSGKSWSDFNLHDPGITILEYLCYALTDIAYRSKFPITDILADRHGTIDWKKNSFLLKEEALSSNPVTIPDFRKLVIDGISGIDNVWFEPVMSASAYEYTKGLYHVVIKPGANIVDELAKATEYDQKEIIKGKLIKKVKNLLISFRNLGEHFESFTVLEPSSVYIKAEVLVERGFSPELLLARIYYVLETSLNPPVLYQTETELLSSGLSIEDIYSGPLLRNGIIADSELKNRILILDPFILTKAISNIEGVISVKKFLVSENGIEYGSKSIKIKTQYFPLLVEDLVHQNIGLFIEGYPMHIKRQDASRLLQKFRHAVKAGGTAYNTANRFDSSLMKGNYRNTEEYISIQKLFPAIYRISEEWILTNQPLANIAKSRQLKAYLMFFEQIIANALSQLTNLGNLFSTDLTDDLKTTYFFQPLYNVPDSKYILKAFSDRSPSLSKPDWENFKRDLSNVFIQSVSNIIESDDQFKRRKKRAFNHLLARFNIALDKHPVVLYGAYYDKDSTTRRIDLETAWKAEVIKNIASFTSARSKAYNYLEAEGESTEEAQGFEKKMALLLHIKNAAQRSLTGTLESMRRKLHFQQQEPAADKQSLSSDTTQWHNEDLDIVNDDIGDDAIEEESHDHGNTLVFKNQTENIFQCGIDISNYRIGSFIVKEKMETVLLFKNQDANNWRITSIHTDQYAALKALGKTIEILKEISIESEGFHIVEHIMLKPSLKAEQFGFNFIDTRNKILLKQLHWLSFEQREETVAALVQLATQPANPDYADLEIKLKKLCVIADDGPTEEQLETEQKTSKEVSQQTADERIKRIIYTLQNFAAQKTNFYPRFEFLVRQPDKRRLKEDFFNFRLTVVFPSWPARFQDRGFREFASNLFKEECPAHLRLDILWLPILLMKKFEELYFGWLKALKDDSDHTHLHSLSNRLIKFLVENGVKHA